jgi:Glycine rich protein
MAFGRYLTRAGIFASVIAVVTGGLTAPAQATGKVRTARFESTGAQQTFVVPHGVKTIHVVAVGARGGDALGQDIGGGLGAKASADITVHAGEKLYIEVGGTGGNDGTAGFNGGGFGGSNNVENDGGGGGGGTDVRTVGAAAGASSLTSRIVVAGGGGGGGYATQDGGAAGKGGLPNCTNCAGGGAGTHTAGGAGGNGGGGEFNGQDGVLGVGGGGGIDGFESDPEGGGGGGGGLYGGGGGSTIGTSSGGGGGGSSGFDHSATKTSIAADTTGIPSVTLTYLPIVSTKSTVAVSTRRTRLSVHGTVSPAAPGVHIAVTLLRQHGGRYRKAAEKHPLLSTTGHYSTSFRRLKPGRCELKVAFEGYQNLAASRATKKLAC